MNSGIVLEFDASHHAVVVLLDVPPARTPLLKLYWQRATSVLPRCVCYLAHLGPHLNSQRQLRKNQNFGTATRVEIMQREKAKL